MLGLASINLQMTRTHLGREANLFILPVTAFLSVPDDFNTTAFIVIVEY